MQFKNVTGLKSVKEKLIRDVNENRISHAQLFLGDPGFGGLALALAFSQYIFCENKSQEDSCGVCGACQKVAKLQHPDLHFSFPTPQAISKTSTPLLPEWRKIIQTSPYFSLNQWVSSVDNKGRIPIISTNESLEIVKRLTLKSFEGGYKISILWMAETMNAVCANKLLKIIEEPPAKTLFILVAASQENIMSTILSRTQILKIPKLEDDDIRSSLSDNFNIFDRDLLNSIVAQAEGSLINANEIAENQQINNQNRTDFIQLMRVCYKKDVLLMLDWADKLAGYNKDDQQNFLIYALNMIRQSLIKNYKTEQLVRASEEELAFLNKFSKFITNNNVADFMSLFDHGHYYLTRNAHAKLLFTNITFEVMRFIHRA